MSEPVKQKISAEKESGELKPKYATVKIKGVPRVIDLNELKEKYKNNIHEECEMDCMELGEDDLKELHEKLPNLTADQIDGYFETLDEQDSINPDEEEFCNMSHDDYLKRMYRVEEYKKLKDAKH